MTDEKQAILIVEDDLDIADMLNAYFRVQGYDVETVNWGEDAVSACARTLPDLVILDIRLPDIDGYEVARRLRSNRRTKDIPIIFLTEKRARSDRLQGLELGADDYITKPFDVQELRLRVRNAMRRSTQGTLTNPVTNLPEGALVEERLKELLGKADWVVVLVCIQNLDSCREAYGFVASDDVLRAISLMIQNAVQDIGGTGDFVGQYNHNQFLIVTTATTFAELAERVRLRLEQSLDYFYPLKDRGQAELGGKRLTIRISQLTAGRGPFRSLDHLKKQLMVD